MSELQFDVGSQQLRVAFQTENGSEDITEDQKTINHCRGGIVLLRIDQRSDVIVNELDRFFEFALHNEDQNVSEAVAFVFLQ